MSSIRIWLTGNSFVFVAGDFWQKANYCGKVSKNKIGLCFKFPQILSRLHPRHLIGLICKTWQNITGDWFAKFVDGSTSPGIVGNWCTSSDLVGISFSILQSLLQKLSWRSLKRELPGFPKHCEIDVEVLGFPKHCEISDSLWPVVNPHTEIQHELKKSIASKDNYLLVFLFNDTDSATDPISMIGLWLGRLGWAKPDSPNSSDCARHRWYIQLWPGPSVSLFIWVCSHNRLPVAMHISKIKIDQKWLAQVDSANSAWSF